MIKVRFLPVGPDRFRSVGVWQRGFGPEQDHEMPVVPRIGEHVEFSAPDGSPISFEVTEVHWILHEVIPADVVVVVTVSS
jgi:hypothetical protein